MHFDPKTWYRKWKQITTNDTCRVHQPWAPPPLSYLNTTLHLDTIPFPIIVHHPHGDPKPVEVFNVILEAIVSIEQPQGILQPGGKHTLINIPSLFEEIEQQWTRFRNVESDESKILLYYLQPTKIYWPWRCSHLEAIWWLSKFSSQRCKHPHLDIQFGVLLQEGQKSFIARVRSNGDGQQKDATCWLISWTKTDRKHTKASNSSKHTWSKDYQLVWFPCHKATYK